MKTKRDRFLQQGDVIIIPVDSIPQQNVGIINTDLVQHGESGHSHRLMGIPGNAFNIMEFKDDSGQVTKYLDIKADIVALSHEEHKTIELKTGKYKIGIVREWNYDEQEAQNVMD